MMGGAQRRDVSDARRGPDAIGKESGSFLKKRTRKLCG
jgi:hypothetical protein